jgi:histidinol dehydrogenase
MSIWIIKADEPSEDSAVAAVRERLRSGDLTSTGTGKIDVPEAVREIIADVKARGDEAVIDQTERLEHVRLTSETLRVSHEQIDAAHGAADEDFLALIRRVIANIREYQQSILLSAPPMLKRDGRTLGVRYTPLDRAGVYVPGGRALYPSTVLMTVVPAQVAGVGEIAMLSPPTTDGDVSPMVLALAGELGVTEVYRTSGTPGVAALGLGTESIPAVHKIVGPGNAFIAEAKKQLFGRVGIDSIAGPSEVLIVADDTANAQWIAADLLAQAEHDPGSAVLVTPSAQLAREVAMAIETQIETLERRDALRSALQTYSAIIVVKSLDAACDVANDFATEHLQIITADDDACLEKIHHAGAIFVGAHTPVPLGDYYAGPSHVLPTGGTARFFGPLSCNDFLKASSVLRYDAASLDADANDVIDFASREGLTAHAASVRIRTRN